MTKLRRAWEIEVPRARATGQREGGQCHSEPVIARALSRESGRGSREAAGEGWLVLPAFRFPLIRSSATFSRGEKALT
ncbi:MAG: hypothetical protein ACXVJT_19105, partial [Thermoanaerobaculia bacterium]